MDEVDKRGPIRSASRPQQFHLTAPEFRPQVRSNPLQSITGQHWPVRIDHGPIRLRPLRRSDVNSWNRVRARNWGWLKNWEPTMPAGVDQKPLTFSELVRAFQNQAKQGLCLPWVVEYVGPTFTAELIGQVSVTGITYGSARWAQIGYWIDQSYAGRGIIPVAVALAMDYCFDTLGLHRIEIVIRPENRKSIRVVEKLGLREEGLRPQYLHIDGAWRDHRVFAMHAEERASLMIEHCPPVKLNS